MHGLENSEAEHEPNEFESEFVFEPPPSLMFSQALAASAPRPQEGHDSILDESKLSLLDTACTSCLHSRRWRQAYERWLPEGIACSRNSQSKNFHFANGQSESQLAVWKVPVYLDNIYGEIFSAELLQGSTPLLLSLPTMRALGMIIDLGAGTVEIKALGTKMVLARTATKHIALDVAYDPSRPLAQPKGSQEDPDIATDDLIVYYLGEGELPVLHEMSFADVSFETFGGKCPDLGRRGIGKGDRLAQLSDRRATELAKTCRRQAAEDQRSWAALRREFSIAEQWCTEGFQNTFVFEPYFSKAPVSDVAMREFSWTCSRPLPQDGFDVLAKKGEGAALRTLSEHRPYLLTVLFGGSLWTTAAGRESGRSQRKIGHQIARLVVRLCHEQHRWGRYYLLEAPPAKFAWVFDHILAQTLKSAGGKFVLGDLCAYGARGRKSQQPVQRRTGWLSNCEVLLNHLGRRCQCKAGVHEPGPEQEMEYPPGLSRAICRGIHAAMVLDYAVGMAHLDGKHAYAGGDPDEDGDLEMEESYDDESPSEEPWEDEWEFIGRDRLLRIHRVPRRRLFLPLSTTAPPLPLDKLQARRRTTMNLQDGTRRELDDSWHHGRIEQKMDFLWTGTTEFFLLVPEPAQEEQQQEPPQEPRDHRDPLPEELANSEYAPSEMEPEVPQPRVESLPFDPQVSAVPVDSEPEQAEEEQQEPQQEPRDHRVLRRGRRQRQLQRGFWQECEEESVLDLLEATTEHLRESGAGTWFRLGTDSDLGRAWVALEAGRADVVLILCSLTARRMKQPQPHAGPLDAPLRKSFLLLNGREVLVTDWEDWNSMAPSAQVRPLVAQGRRLYVAIYGKEVGDGGQIIEAGPGDRQQAAELSRRRKWDALPRELKLAVRRVHVNLGHAPQAAMLRALRISRASETAIKACRLFRCPDCPRLSEPKLPRPSKLPLGLHVDLAECVRPGHLVPGMQPAGKDPC